MAEFTKERVGKPTPILVLPRGRSGRSTESAPKAVEVYLQFGKKPAGCLVCNRVIPPQTSRLSITARFPTSWLGMEPDPHAADTTTQTYYVHPGCLTDRIKPEVIRFAADCYDCGAVPPKSDNMRGFEEHLRRCFTVSKFAPGRLCEACARKPRWRFCRVCEVYFPHWMISRVAVQRENTAKPAGAINPFGTVELEIDAGTDVCEFCAQRHHLVTEEQAAESRSEYERLRRDIMEQGIFDAGDS